jgi:hypothetical protein
MNEHPDLMLMSVAQVIALHNKWQETNQTLSFREFMLGVKPTFGMDNAVTVPWCGMWLCVERDGYVHT